LSQTNPDSIAKSSSASESALPAYQYGDRLMQQSSEGQIFYRPSARLSFETSFGTRQLHPISANSPNAQNFRFTGLSALSRLDYRVKRQTLVAFEVSAARGTTSQLEALTRGAVVSLQQTMRTRWFFEVTAGYQVSTPAAVGGARMSYSAAIGLHS